MLILHTQLRGVPVMSLQTGDELGQTADPIIDPRQLKIVAFHCVGAGIPNGSAVLHISDIRELGNMGFIVDDADVLMNPSEDLVRLQEVMRLNFELIDKVVFDTRGKKIGKIQSYSVDSNSFYIIKLNVAQPLLKSFMQASSLIDRSQIVEVTDRAIVVKSTEVKASQPTKAAPIVGNPFRSQPQTNNSKR